MSPTLNMPNKTLNLIKKAKKNMSQML